MQQNYTMLCDFYELTMANGYFASGKSEEIAYFDVFFRQIPDGGGFAIAAGLDQIIDYINPEGTISIMGVSEDLAPINTRMVLEKGLRIFGSSRSGRSDFQGLINLYRENPDVVNQLEKIVGAELNVRSIQDITTAFEADIHKIMGKTVMIWEN